MRKKRELDQIDVKLVKLLAENARRPFSDLADHVGLSPPAVADRIERLQEQGIIRRFTIDIDRLKLQHRTPVLVEFKTHPSHSDTVYEEVCALPGIEHVFKLYDGKIIAHGNAPDSNPKEWLHGGIDMDRIVDLDIGMLDQYEWTLTLDEAEFSLPCPVCGSSVEGDGVTAEIGDRTLSFCCTSCEEKYIKQYENYQSNQS